jgi:hypothetical protein
MKSKRYPIRLTEVEADRFQDMEEIGIKRSFYVRGSIKAVVDVIEECELQGLYIRSDVEFLDIVKLVFKEAVLASKTKYYKEYYEKLRGVVTKKRKEMLNNEIPFIEDE